MPDPADTLAFVILEQIGGLGHRVDVTYNLLDSLANQGEQSESLDDAQLVAVAHLSRAILGPGNCPCNRSAASAKRSRR